MPHPELILFFFVIAFVYASVGFGGGSSYLAVLALYALPVKELRLIALVCNVVVVTGGAVIYLRQKEVTWKKVWPLITLSIPLSFLGASLKISDAFFFVLLGCTLVVAALFLWIDIKQTAENHPATNSNKFVNSTIGGFIGFLSGLVGIGGGIFLAPLLHLLHWDTAKKIAATASLFILFNSLAGIAGQLNNMPQSIDYTRILLLMIAVFLGGQIGSRIGARTLPARVVRRTTALLVFIAGMEVLSKHFF
jgi:uncharacterized membrane protein YfcA